MSSSPTPVTPPHPADGGLVQAKVIENGPLQVKGPIRIVDHEGNAYDVGGRRTVFLCRCGGSTSKPFCDGTHSRIAFAAAERAVVADQATEEKSTTRP